MRAIWAALLCSAMAVHPQLSSAQTAPPPAIEPAAAAAPEAAAPPVKAEAAKAVLPVGTRLQLATLQHLTTVDNKLGDSFGIIVVEDVSQDGTIVIPKGAQGVGEVTFIGKNGGFGRPGILQIKVVSLNVGDHSLPIDGRFREEGANKNGVAAATYFAVGIFAGFIRGKPGGIERGRLLRARTAEPFEFVIGAAPPPVPDLPPPPGNTEPAAEVPVEKPPKPAT